MEKLSMCRICLAENVRMHIVANRNLHELYEKLTDIPFVTKDTRPTLACSFCCTKLKQCYQLLRQCLKAEEMYAQMMNEDYKPNSLDNQNHLEVFCCLMKSPIQLISIECQTESIAIKDELPAVCEGLDDIIEPKLSEHQSDELELNNLDNSCLDVADIPPQHSQSDVEDDVPLMIKFKAQVKEDPAVSQKKRRATETNTPGRGQGQATDRGPHERFGPSTNEELRIVDITEIGEGLEDPLHAKRRRVRSPVRRQPALPTASTSSASCLPQQMEVEVEEALLAPASPMSAVSVLSPAMYVESPVRRSRPSQPLGERELYEAVNFGSDAGSDESEDEDLPPQYLPRWCRIVMETALDSDSEDVDDAPTADPVLAAIDLAPVSVPPTATDRPWSVNVFEWREFPNPPIPPESRRETFSETNVGPTTPSVDPYDIFVDVWDRQFMEYIALETNRYAQQLTYQMWANDSLHPHSRVTKWRDTNADELYLYFGIVIAMGIVVKSTIEDYWNATPDIFYTPGFGAHMSLQRFELLSKCLHFRNNQDMCGLRLNGSEARLFKIQPILSHLNMKFSSLYIMSQNILLDESLLQWKGWLDIRQSIPNKTASMGIKTYEICESQTGYLWQFEVHAHKRYENPSQRSEDPLNESTPSIVLRLAHGLENKGYTLWMDNFYNSPILARRLKALGFDCVGTLRTNRKFVPQALHRLTKGDMRPGQITGLTSGDIDIMVWRDNNRVAMVSTYHGNAARQVQNTTKPILILDYNIMMGGVDKRDQMLAMYPIERKRTKVWYKKLFRRLLNVSILNSFVIHRAQPGPSLTHRKFRESLVKSLMSKHFTPNPNSIPPVIALNQRGEVTHRIEKYPRLASGQSQRRRCTVCKKRVLTFCVGCKKPLCQFDFHSFPHTVLTPAPTLPPPPS